MNKSPVIDLAPFMVKKRLELSRDERQVDGLIGLLRLVADELESGSAVEMDFDTSITEGQRLNEINITLQTFHLRTDKKELKRG